MGALAEAGKVRDVFGEENTNVGNMFRRIKTGMADLAQEASGSVRITDLLAVDTLAPVEISGALAGETCMEKAVGIAAMVKTEQLPMERIARKMRREMGIYTTVAGVEAVMASLGALTTPGTQLPIAILDMGGGSTDAAVITEDGRVRTTHQAGAGELVTLLIQTELGLESRITAEQIDLSVRFLHRHGHHSICEIPKPFRETFPQTARTQCKKRWAAVSEMRSEHSRYFLLFLPSVFPLLVCHTTLF